jgi:hypothetical protein
MYEKVNFYDLRNDDRESLSIVCFVATSIWQFSLQLLPRRALHGSQVV